MARACGLCRYQIPNEGYGQKHVAGDALNPYLRVNDSAPLLASGQMVGDENEEYEENWSSDWRTSEPATPDSFGYGKRGGAYNASAPPQGSVARFGPFASFNYRFLVSSLRALQMRVSYMLASATDVVRDDVFAYVALELGRTAEDAPDAFCFLIATEFNYGRGMVSHMERWLYQRDEPESTAGGVVTFPDAPVTQTPASPSNYSYLGGSWMTCAPPAIEPATPQSTPAPKAPATHPHPRRPPPLLPAPRARPAAAQP